MTVQLGGFLVKEPGIYGESAPSVPKIGSVSRSLESGAKQAVLRAGAYTKTNMKLTISQTQMINQKLMHLNEFRLKSM